MSDELRDQINEIIEADIQLKINDYIEKEGKCVPEKDTESDWNDKKKKEKKKKMDY